jgi:hypothetical protein
LHPIAAKGQQDSAQAFQPRESSLPLQDDVTLSTNQRAKFLGAIENEFEFEFEVRFLRFDAARQWDNENKIPSALCISG